MIAGRLPGVIDPARFSQHAQKFPRSMMWGRILSAVCALWALVVMYNAATDDWAWARPFVVIGMPVGYWLVVQYADQFLALRGLAGLLLLIAKVALDAADLSELPLRLVVTVLAYLWVCAAIWMAAAPHQVRDVIGFLTANSTRCRAACFLGAALGALLVALGLFVY
jgi:hypothetical protein